jgi:RNA polymerase sigma factor (sigma-70 family)
VSAHSPSLHALYADHHGWLHGWLRRKLGCAHHASDVAHDTFMRLINSRDALLGMREPRAYLTTTAQRLLIDEVRHKRLEHAYLEALALSCGDRHHPSPEQTLVAVQSLQQIADALAAVSVKAREAFLLHYLEGLTHDQVAVRLGVSARMVRNYLVRALTECHLALDAGDA